MSYKTKKKFASEDYSTSYAQSYSSSTVHNLYADSQLGFPSAASGKTTASTSALLKALDAPTTSSGKKRRKVTSGDDVDGEKPKTKRVKKTKDLDAPSAPAPEKRGAIFKKKCPKNIIDRVERVISQRFFMIDRRRNGDELKEEFSVLGSTGNVYTVTIDKRPSCTCPDATKGNHCKHILFVFLKVFQVSQCSSYWYQKALLTSELEDLFRKAPPAPNAMANEKIRNAYNRATGKASSSANVDQPRRMPGAGDDCPVCYEGMHDAQESSLTWCSTCGNALHKECFQQWAKKKRTNPDCVYCRAPWTGTGAASAGGASTGEGYLNLAGAAGLSPKRDTSSYYQGPRRGQHYYGYQDYDDDFGD